MRKETWKNKNDSESSFQTLSHCLGWWSVCVCPRAVGGGGEEGESVPPDVHSIPPSPPYTDTQTWWGRDAEGGWLYQTQRQPRFRTSRHQLSVSHKGISLTHFFLTKDSLSLSLSAFCWTCVASSKMGHVRDCNFDLHWQHPKQFKNNFNTYESRFISGEEFFFLFWSQTFIWLENGQSLFLFFWY